MRRVVGLLAMALCFALGAPSVWAQTVDYAGGDLVISSDTVLSGYHYNIGQFRITSGKTVTVGGSGSLVIRALDIDIQGHINADYKGAAGGLGGEGGLRRKGGKGGGDAAECVHAAGRGKGGAYKSSDDATGEMSCWVSWCSRTQTIHGGGGGAGGGGGGGYGTAGCDGPPGNRGRWDGCGKASDYCVAGPGTAGSAGVGGQKLNVSDPAAGPGCGGGGPGGGGGGHVAGAVGRGRAGSGGGLIWLEALGTFTMSATATLKANGERAEIDPISPVALGGDAGDTTGEGGGFFCSGNRCKNYYRGGGNGNRPGAGSGGAVLIASPSITIPVGAKIQVNGGVGYDSTRNGGTGAGGSGIVKVYRDAAHYSVGAGVFEAVGCGNATFTVTPKPIPVVKFVAKDNNGNVLDWVSFNVSSRDYVSGASGQNIPMLKDSGYALSTPVIQVDLVSQVAYFFKQWEIGGDMRPDSQTTYFYDGALTEIVIRFEVVDYYRWTGVVSNDWHDPLNWKVYSSSNPGGVVPDEKPQTYHPVIIPPITAPAHEAVVSGTVNVREIAVEAGANLKWNTVAATINLGRGLTINGSFGTASHQAVATSAINLGMDLVVSGAGAEFNMTNVNVAVSGNVAFGPNAKITRSSSDTTRWFRLVGNKDTIFTNYSDTFTIPVLTVFKGTTTNKVTMLSTVGAALATDVAKQALDEVVVRKGILELGGTLLTVEKALTVSAQDGDAGVYLSRDPVVGVASTLRIVGKGVSSPIVLGYSGGFQATLNSTSGSLIVGPRAGEAAASAPDVNSVVNFVTDSARLALDGYSSFVIQDGSNATGWDLTLAGTTVIHNATILVDRNLTFSKNKNVRITGYTTFETGYEHSNGGTLTTPQSGANCASARCLVFGQDVKVIVRGSMDLRGSYFDNSQTAAQYGPILHVEARKGLPSGEVHDIILRSAKYFRDIQVGAGVSLQLADVAMSQMPRVARRFRILAGGETVLTAGKGLNLRGEQVCCADCGGNVDCETLQKCQDHTNYVALGGNVFSCGKTGAVVENFGTLNAEGSAVSPVQFLGGEGYYFGVRALSEGAPLPKSKSLFKHVIFDGIGYQGVRIEDGAELLDTEGMSSTWVHAFTNCTFQNMENPGDGFVMLTIDNDQDVVVDGARFLSSNAPPLETESNVSKTREQGGVVFTNVFCTPAEGCATRDIAGGAHEDDLYNRIHWPLERAELADVRAVEAPLNAERGLVYMRVDPKANTEETLYCLWAKDSAAPTERRYVNADHVLEGTSCVGSYDTCCHWQTFAELGAYDGLEISVQDSATYTFQIASKVEVPLDPPYVEMDENPTLYPSVAGITIPDRTPPTVPVLLGVTPSSPVGVDKHLALNWTASTDPLNPGTPPNYIVLRGRGPDLLGDPALRGADAPYGAIPTDFRPINGEWDSFTPGYVGGVWSEGGGNWQVTQGRLSGNAMGNLASRVLVVSGDGYQVSSSTGYIMQADLQRQTGSEGVYVTFMYHGVFILWSIGEPIGSDPVYYQHRIHHDGTANPLVVQMDGPLAAGVWHQVMVYVKGNVARGYMDGVKVWELNQTGAVAHGIARGFGFAFEGSTSALFDNVLIAPFLTSGGTPATSWTDTAAIDIAGPLTPTYTRDHVQASADPNRIDLFVRSPESPNNPTGALWDRGTAYFYHVVAVDATGNTSNILQNRGFEGLNFAVWTQALGDPLLLGSTVALEGYHVGGVDSPPALAVFGRQNLSYTWPANAILRFQRYTRMHEGTYASGSVFPAVIHIGYPSSTATIRGMEYTDLGAAWRLVETYAQFGSTAPNTVAVWAEAGAAIPDYSVDFDQNRVDLMRAEIVTQGYAYTQVQYRPEAYPLNAWYHLTTGVDGMVSDIGGPAAPASFETDNAQRFYRFRSCDSRLEPSGTRQNCGPWRGGYSCTVFADCPSGKGFTKCHDFNGEKYCADASEMMYGVERWTRSNVPSKPVLEAATNNVDLRLKWDEAKTNNRQGTQFLVHGWSAEAPGLCATAGTPRGYLKPNVDNKTWSFITSPTPEQFEEIWSTNTQPYDNSKVSGIDRSRTINGLNPNLWYCYRVLARNGDKVPTGDIYGASDWAGWSEMSNESQPPFMPKVVLGSATIKYGTGASAAKKAMPVNGSTYQEVAFVIEDQNNFGAYMDVTAIRIGISPHADWTHAGASASQRGLFAATYSSATSSWTFSELGTDFGNNKVVLQSAGCSVTRNGTFLNVIFRWTLSSGLDGTTIYRSQQDQGIQISIEDASGMTSQWDQTANRLNGCSQVFHTSYLPPAPTLVSPLDLTWTRADSIRMEAQGVVDTDQSLRYNLWAECQPNCAAWGWDLTGPDNCVDTASATGDPVRYHIGIYASKDSNGRCSGALKAPATEVWSLMTPEDGIYKGVENLDIRSTVLPEGKYYWCAKAKDHHVYTALEEWLAQEPCECATSADCAYGSVCEDACYCRPTGIVQSTQTRMIGIDRTAPTWQTDPLTAYNCDTGNPIENAAWQFGSKIRFSWTPAVRDPLGIDTNPSDPITSPLRRYFYVFIPGDASLQATVNPATHASRQEVQHVDSQGYFEVSYCTEPLAFGEYQFGVVAEDSAGNLSVPIWHDLRIDREQVDPPCILSSTHPFQDTLYCDPENSNENFRPIVELIDPRTTNAARFASGNPDNCPNYTRLALSGIQAYSFTISRKVSNTTVDSIPEDTNAPGKISSCDGDPGCQIICDPMFANCMDTNQSGYPAIDRFRFVFYDGESGRPDTETDNIYHSLRYFLVDSQGQPRAGAYTFKIRGWTEAGGMTSEGKFEFNICECGKEFCKDETPDRLRAEGSTEGMTRFGGGLLALGGALSGSGASGGVMVEPFYLDDTEISNAEYEACVRQGVCSMPGDQDTRSATRESYFGDARFSDYPVLNMSWDMAQSYCAWRGKRLPTELEWRFAAQQVAGEAATRKSALPNDLYTVGDTVPVDEPHGPVSPELAGPLNLFTNVAEWVADWWLPESHLDFSAAPAGPDGTRSCREYCSKTLGASNEQGQLIRGELMQARRWTHTIQPTRMPTEAASDPTPVLLHIGGQDASAEGPTGQAVDLSEVGLVDDSCLSLCTRKVVMGGSFAQSLITPMKRAALGPTRKAADVGFRCAISPADVVEHEEEPQEDAQATGPGPDMTQTPIVPAMLRP